MKQSAFVDYVVQDLLSEMDSVRSRAMFGGYGIYKENVMFAIIVEDELYFKVDETNREEFEKRGSRPFTYESRGKTVTMSYWEVPAEVMDDPQEIRRWAEISFQIGRKIQKGRSVRHRSSPASK